MKKILIVSPYFAPENSIAAIRFTKIAKYLQKLGHDVTVICTRMNASIKIDKTLEKDLQELKQVVQINYPQLLYYKVQEHFGAGTENAGASLSNPGLAWKIKDNLVWGYVYFCNYLLVGKYKKYVRESGVKYDVVISTYSPIFSHTLGAYMKKKSLCGEWIADFRDSMTMLERNYFVRNFVHNYGSRLVKQADYITAASRGCLEKLIEETKEIGVDIKDKIIQINNGYDSEDRDILGDIHPPKNILTFAYCGSMYIKEGKVRNDMTPFWEVLSELIQEGKLKKSNVSVHYAGNDQSIMKKYAEKYNLLDVICLYGPISRDESLRLQRKSDVILVSVWNNRGECGIISGKFYETLLVERNVLGIITGNERNSELAQMINEMDCGFAYEEVNGDKGRRDALKKWILERYLEKLEKEQIVYRNMRKDEPYSHLQLAKRFEALFEK